LAESPADSIRPYEGDEPYVFICYSHADRRVLDEIRWLQEHGINVWFDQGITPGSVWTEALAKKIEGSDSFLYFLSKSSANSEHCQKELIFAQDEKKRVIAVQLEPFELPSGLRLSLRNRQIIHRFELNERESRTRLASALSRDAESVQLRADSDTGPKASGRFKWVALALVAAAISVGALLLYQNQRASRTGIAEEQLTAPIPEEAKPGVAERPSIAVLPFDNMSGDPDQEYFSDSLTDEIISRLSRNSGLFVTSRNSTFTYKGRAVKAQQIGQELGVKSVLEGSVLKAMDRIRVTAQLIDTATEGHLWSDTYHRELEDIFKVQAEIAQHIAASLRVEYSKAELERVKRIPTEKLSSYDAYWRGQEHYWRRTKEANAQARVFYRNALELDPGYAEALAALGLSYWTDYYTNWNSDPEVLEQAYELARKANALDESTAHGLLARIYASKHQFRQAIAEAERALAIDPSNAETHITMGEILTMMERPVEAIEVVERAIRLNPKHDANYLTLLGTSYSGVGRYEDAVTALKKGLSLNPDWMPTYARLARLYSGAKRYEEAIAIAQKGLSLNSDWAEGYIELARCYRLMGRYDDAFALIEEALSLNPDFHWAYQHLAFLHRTLGQYEKAIAVLEEALARNPDNLWLRSELTWICLIKWQTQQNTDPRALDQATEMANNMLALAEDSMWSHFPLSAIYLARKQHDKAIAEAEKVIELTPAYHDGYAMLAHIYNSVGRSEEAIELLEGEMQRTGIRPWYYISLGTAYALSGRQNEALVTYGKVFDYPHVYETSFRAHIALAILYSRLGQKESAGAEAAEILKIVPDFSVDVWGEKNPMKDREQVERDMAALRKAGLPD